MEPWEATAWAMKKIEKAFERKPDTVLPKDELMTCLACKARFTVDESPKGAPVALCAECREREAWLSGGG